MLLKPSEACWVVTKLVWFLPFFRISFFYLEYLLFNGREELKFVGERMTFEDAQAYCEAEQAMLVVVSWPLDQ